MTFFTFSQSIRLTSFAITFSGRLSVFSNELKSAPQDSPAAFNVDKTILGIDAQNNLIFYLPCNRDTVLYCETIYNEFEVLKHNLDEIKDYIEDLAKSNNAAERVLLTKL